MSLFQTAKTTAENALKQIGAFPSSMEQADEGELRTSLQWLEMTLNSMSGIRAVAGFYRMVDIPIEAGIGDYLLSDYADAAETQHVFSVNIVDNTGRVDPLPLIYESDAIRENLKQTGDTRRATVTKDVLPILRIYPTPTQEMQNAGQVLRLRIQTYHTPISKDGVGDTDLLIRPSWYLMLTKRLAYEIGCGPVRRLADGELKRFKDDADKLESLLIARDGQNTSGTPPVTEPMAGSLL